MSRLELAVDVANLSRWPRTSRATNLLQGARHAVLRTLCSHAHRIGLDGTSCLLDGLRKNVSFSFFIVVVVCVLVCPTSEVVVLSEQQPQGFGDPLTRRTIVELTVELYLIL